MSSYSLLLDPQYISMYSKRFATLPVKRRLHKACISGVGEFISAIRVLAHYLLLSELVKVDG